MNEKDAIHGIVTADDNLPRMNIWMLQDPEKRELLKVALKPELLDTTAALIVIDLDQPWDMKESLFKWMRLLEELVKDVLKIFLLKRGQAYKNGLKGILRNTTK